MNIEEERKAFIEHFPNAGTVIFDKENNVFKTASDSKWQCDVVEYANRIWPVWLAAKAHAEEMAKPKFNLVNIDRDGMVWALMIDGAEHATFRSDRPMTKEKVLAWAEKQAYKVGK